MNDTRSTHRRGRLTARLAVVLCLMVVVGMLPTAAFAVPAAGRSWSDVNSNYLNSATIHLTGSNVRSLFYSLDGGSTVESSVCVTAVYGSHTLAYYSDDVLGIHEATQYAPFFVDEDAAPTVVCDVKGAYTLSASIVMTATDNFNGSGVSYLYYRVDDGALQQVVSSKESLRATALVAALGPAAVRVAAGAPDLPSYDVTPPAGHSTMPCATCHGLITTPPTEVDGGIAKTITVSGVGTHKIEYWAQDIARNQSAKVTTSFTISKIATSLSIARSKSSVTHGNYVTVSGKLSGGMTAGAPVVLQYKAPGTTVYKSVTRTTTLTGGWSYKIKLSKVGKYYFRAKYAGTDSYAACNSATIYVTSK